MAFNPLNVVTDGALIPAIGSFTAIAVGEGTCVSGKITITARGLRSIEGIVGVAQGATGVGETVICTATATNTADLETVDESGNAAGTSVIMWLAWGTPLA